MAKFSLIFSVVASAAIAQVQSNCPSEDYKEASNRCYRTTKAGSKGTTLCDRAGETQVTGKDVNYFNYVKALFLASGNGGGPSQGAGGPGKFFWVAASAGASSYVFDDLTQVRDSDGNIIARADGDPGCLAGWSRSPDFVPVDCDAFYPALCEHPICPNGPKPIQQEWLRAQFSVEYAFTNECDDKTDPANYYLSPDGVSGEGFTLHLGCNVSFNTMKIKNTHNAFHNDRGTNEYTVSVSDYAEGPFTAIYNGQLTDVRNEDCDDVPTVTVNFGQVHAKDFVRVTIDSYYGKGGGLQYINFDLV